MKGTVREVNHSVRTSVLTNGELVIFKLLGIGDGSALTNFFSQVSEREAETLRHDVHDPAVIAHWIETLDYQQTLPLLAWNESSEHIAGVASLHFSSGVRRHVADIRLVVGRDYRKLGLGSAMIKELVEAGNQQ